MSTENMSTEKSPVQELERRQVLHDGPGKDGQYAHVEVTRRHPGSALDALVERSLARALAHDSKLAPEIRSVIGMSGQIYRSFINNLVEGHGDARYFEIGAWAGSTATAALYGNAAQCLCIDDWSGFGGPKEQFFANIEKVRSDRIDFRFIEGDFRQVDFSALGRFNIYMFDGPHAEKDQYDGIVLLQAALENSYVLIVDDWNWKRVRDGTLQALIDTGSRLGSSIEVRTSFDNSQPEINCGQSDWHNGYFVAVVHKPA